MPLRYAPGSHVAAVAPTHHAHPSWIGNTHLDYVVYSRHQIFIIAAAPSLDVRVAKLLTVAGRTSRIHAQNRKAARGKHLERIRRTTADQKRLREDPGWTAVNIQQQRHALAGLITNRIGQQTLHLHPVAAL